MIVIRFHNNKLNNQHFRYTKLKYLTKIFINGTIKLIQPQHSYLNQKETQQHYQLQQIRLFGSFHKDLPPF